MSNHVYQTIEALNYAILSNQIAYKRLRLSFDGGEVIIKNTDDGQDVYRGSEQGALIEFFQVFFSIRPEIL